MAYQFEKNLTDRRRCIRHNCTNDAVWRVATTRWWKLHDKRTNDGRTGIVFEQCEEHLGVGFKPRKVAP